MPVSEARKKANQKWDTANLDRISVAMPKGMKDTVKTAAVAAGESMNQYIIGAVEQRIGGIATEKPTQNTVESLDSVLTPPTLKTAQEAAQKAKESVPEFIERAVTTQSERDRRARMFGTGE